MKFFPQLKRGPGIKLMLAGLLTSVALGGSAMYTKVSASDHDDGETNIKSRNLNLTDLYVFREDWETGVPADAGNLILVMNTNPRSLPRQQYFFNTNAFYNFNISRRAGGINQAVNGTTDVNLAFSFGAPNNLNQQPITLTVNQYTNGAITSTNSYNAGTTTAASPLLPPQPLTPPANIPVVATNVTVTTAATANITVFAGLREDPFFFDVEAFFKTRASLANNGPILFAATKDTAQDFAQGYNVNSIVARVPISLLQTGAAEKVFDVWETITIPSTTAALQ